MKGAGHDHARKDVDPYPGEQYILSVDRYQIEVMDHLDELPATGAVIFCTFPKVRWRRIPRARFRGLPRGISAQRKSFFFITAAPRAHQTPRRHTIHQAPPYADAFYMGR